MTAPTTPPTESAVRAACKFIGVRDAYDEFKAAKLRIESDNSYPECIEEDNELAMSFDSVDKLARIIDASCHLPELKEVLEKVRAEIERLSLLASLVTVRQVIEGGDKYIEAAGLNPWCMNEGLANGSETVATNWRTSEALAAIEKVKI